MRSLPFQRGVKRVMKRSYLLEKEGVNFVLGSPPVEKLKLKNYVGKTW